MVTFRLIVAAFLLLPTAGQAQFSFPYSCDARNPAKLCLIDKHPKLQSVVLFSQHAGNRCKARTLEAFEDSESGPSPFPATKLQAVDCPQGNYDVAYLGKDTPSYSTLTLQRLRDARIAQSVHARISRTEKYKKLLSYFQKSLSKQPVLYRIPSPQDNTYLAHYTIDRNGKEYGPLFFVTDNEVTEVDAEASIVRAMRIGTFTYLLIEHSCWGGCGDVYTALIRFGDGKSARVAVNGYWST